MFFVIISIDLVILLYISRSFAYLFIFSFSCSSWRLIQFGTVCMTKAVAEDKDFESTLIRSSQIRIVIQPNPFLKS